MSGTTEKTEHVPHPLVAAFTASQQAICDHCGYVAEWRIFPLEDLTEMHWHLDAPSDVLTWSPDRDQVLDALTGKGDGAQLYSGVIYPYCHLPQHVFRGAELSLLLIDTRCDGNINLFIVRNDHEVTL